MDIEILCEKDEWMALYRFFVREEKTYFVAVDEECVTDPNALSAYYIWRIEHLPKTVDINRVRLSYLLWHLKKYMSEENISEITAKAKSLGYVER